MFSLISYMAFAQTNLVFQNLTSTEGLSQNSIYSILEDKYGFLWFGTRDGLNRYDGYKIDQFYNEPFNNNSLSSNQIRTIIEDPDGNFLIGTVAGLCKYLIDQDKFIQIPLVVDSGAKEPNIYSLIMYDSSTVWIGTENGLLSYNFTDNKLNEIYPQQLTETITAMLKDSVGDIWLSTFDKIWKYKNNASGDKLEYIVAEFSEYNLHGPFFEDSKHKVWMSSSGGIYIGTPGSDIVIPATQLFPWISSSEIKDVSEFAEMNEDQMWIGQKGGGLILLQFDKNKIYNYSSDIINPSNTSSANISSLLVDKSNKLWVGTNGAGISFWNPRKFNFGLIRNKNNYIVNKSIRAIYKEKKETIWIGGYRGLDKYNSKSGQIKHFDAVKNNKEIPRRTVYSIAPDPYDSNYIWIGFESGGFCKFNKTTNSYVYYPDKDKKFSYLRTKTVTKLLFDRQGFIWMGTASGLLKLNRNLEVLSYFGTNNSNHIINDEVINLLEDVEGNIWVATSLAGIYKINLIKNTIKSYVNVPDNLNSLKSDRTYSLLQDSYGYIWIGTDSGLDRLDPVSDTFLHLDSKSGLPNNTIYGILADEYNNLWLSTNNGISKYDPKRNTFTNFDMRFNLQDKEFNINAFHKGYDGEMFFGGINGVNNFYPQQVVGNNIFPPVYLTDLKIFNQSVKSGMQVDGNIILNKSITASEEIDLNYNQNSISFEFAALEYFSNQYINYSYILENYENDWNIAGTRRFASYANLQPGSYIFKVKSTNLEGDWNTKFTSVIVNIKPPIWKSFAAYIFYSLLGLLLFIQISFYYRKRIQQKENEVTKEREISEKLRQADKLKDNFLAQISHEIRTPINTIFNYTSLLKEAYRETDDPDIGQSFEAIDLAGRRIIRTIELILNLSEIQTGSYIYTEKTLNISEDILEKIFSEFLLNAKRKGLNLIWKTKASGLYIRGDEYSITQIISNLVENAIKYTLDGQVEIKLRETEKNIFVDVEDTGIGISEEYLPNLFDPFSQESEGYTRQYEGNGLGLALVKKYCEMNNVKIYVSSRKEHGTIFTLEFTRV